jgi:hypothetical protein
MNPELEKQLVKDYPTIFQFHGGSPKETCMAWGCEHDDGWFDLLKNLCDYITAVTRRDICVSLKEGLTEVRNDHEWKNTFIPPVKVRFTQVKEKFAGLRIYFDTYHELSDEIYDRVNEDSIEKERNRTWTTVSEAIEFTEFLSTRICEFCGNKGKVYRDGWWKTLCPKCADSRNRFDVTEEEVENNNPLYKLY